MSNTRKTKQKPRVMETFVLIVATVMWFSTGHYVLGGFFSAAAALEFYHGVYKAA